MIRTAVFVVLFGVDPALSFDDRLAAGGVQLGLGLVSVVLLLLLVGVSAWQLVTGARA